MLLFDDRRRRDGEGCDEDDGVDHRLDLSRKWPPKCKWCSAVFRLESESVLMTRGSESYAERSLAIGP